MEKTKYTSVSHHQNTGQNQNIKIAIRYFQIVSQFKYLETAVTNQICIQEEIKSRLNSGNDSHHSVQNLLPSCLLSKNVKIWIYLWFIRVWNLVSNIKGGTQIEGVWEECVENIWIKEGRSYRRMDINIDLGLTWWCGWTGLVWLKI
jgi:hypothetical protein